MHLAVAGDNSVSKIKPENEENKEVGVMGQNQEPAKVM